MKRAAKKRATTRARRAEPEPEENIFNPFAPLLRVLRRGARSSQGTPKHPFRDTFITVVLVHVIGVLAFLTLGAIKDSSKKTATGKGAKVSEVSKILGKQPQLLPLEDAEPGERLVAVAKPTANPMRDADAASPRNASNANTGRENRTAEAAKKVASTQEEPLPAVTSAMQPVSSSSVLEDSPERPVADPIREAFLAATGRSQSTPLPEVRRAEAVPSIAPKGEPTSPTAARAEVAAPAYAGVTEYKVGRGDNVFLIASRLGVSYSDLAEANNLSSPRDLRVGQTLVVPRVEDGSM